MLVIERKDEMGTLPSIKWHIGEPIPTFHLRQEITLVQADGDELEHIRHSITGIPISARRVVVWRGIFADFIARNL